MPGNDEEHARAPGPVVGDALRGTSLILTGAVTGNANSIRGQDLASDQIHGLREVKFGCGRTAVQEAEHSINPRPGTIYHYFSSDAKLLASQHISCFNASNTSLTTQETSHLDVVGYFRPRLDSR